MIDQINDYFRFDRSYEEGLKLVMQFTAKMALKKQLNVQPASAYLHGVIHEELRQLCGISHKEFEQIIAQPVLEKATVESSQPVAEPGELPDQTENLPKQKKASRKK